MKKFFDLENPFFAPVWIRVAVVVVMILWGVVELSQGATLWAIIFIGVGGFCGWRFYIIDYSAGPKD
ncbi:MAG: hypothetical protein ABJI96_14210 [Paracoccaceae bacterium]